MSDRTPSSPSLLRRWFGFSTPVGRRFYFLTGLSLMALKYAGDVAILWSATGRWWPPLQWAHPLYSNRFHGFHLSAGEGWPLVPWALPFLWIGITMTVRRAVDAGRSAWWSLLFFLPVVNFLLMIGLSLMPSEPERRAERAWLAEPPPPRSDEMMKSALLGIGLVAVIGTPLVALFTLVFRNYGAGLFLGLPVAIGVCTGFVFNHRHPRTLVATSAVVIAGFAILSGTLMLFALEGAVCLVMAAPIALTAGTFGGWVGREIALRAGRGSRAATLASFALPFAMLTAAPAPPAYREVVSAVEIAAPPEVVWKHVVGFEPLAPPHELLFRAGVAYPVRARITGTGVGAVRRCEFSTGPFVEPITVWDEPRRLGFDVTQSPPPLEEWSPWRHVFAPHLARGFRAMRGEFRLVPLESGSTRLEGSTWYALDIHPTLYWTPWADAFVHRIHGRVLEHIGRLAEQERRGSAAPPVTP